jgi:copper chaperone CopZ
MKGTGTPTVSLLLQLLREVVQAPPDEMRASTDDDIQHWLVSLLVAMLFASSVCGLATRLRVPKCAAALPFLLVFGVPGCEAARDVNSYTGSAHRLSDATLLTCSWADLAAGTDCVRRALHIDGAVAVTGVPGLARARTEAFLALARCLEARPADALSHTLSDGTVRRTLGARTLRGAPEPLVSACDGADSTQVHEATDALRALVDQGTRRFVRALEPLVRPGVALPGGAASLTELVLGVEHLEHFHAYSPRAPPTPPTLFNGSAAAAAEALPPTLPMHVDAGLFISIVPALYLPVPAAAASAAAASGDTGVSAASSSDASASASAPSSSSSSSPPPPDFFVERSDGAYAYLPAHAATDSLLFVLGDGWSHWINPVLKLSLRAAPHTIIVPPRAAADGVGKAVGGAGELTKLEMTKLRLWHGRMVLPPATAPMPSGGDFESWRRGRVAWALEVAAGARDAATAGRNLERELDSSASAAQAEALPAGCAGGGTLLLEDSGCVVPPSPPGTPPDPHAGEPGIRCWMRCQSVKELPCGDKAACVDTSTPAYTPVDPEKMCGPACKPQCLAGPPPPPPGFCDGPPVDMSMRGFIWAGQGADCLMLLHSDFPLDSPVRMSAGVVITLLLGFVVEALACFRRRLVGKFGIRRGPSLPRTWAAISIGMYALQTALAYVLMLIAMTYQSELFIAVIAGLALGHSCFNLRAPVPESADPCCQSMNQLDHLGKPSIQSDGRVAPYLPPASSMAQPLLAGGLVSFTESSQLVSYRLRVTGMVCESCEDTVKRALAAVDGVRSVRVDLPSEESEVGCVPTVGAQVLIEALRKAGHDAFLK